MSDCSIDQAIDVQEWVCILRACLIEIYVVHTHPPLFVWFFDHDHVRKPSGIVNFLDELGDHQLDHFLSYCLTPLFTYLSFSLGNRLCIFKALIDPGHVYCKLCK